MAGQARVAPSTSTPPSDRPRSRRAPARIDATTVRVIAQTIPSAVGGGPLREDVASALAADAEFALRRLVLRARPFMRHARRDTLAAEDLAAALRLRGVAPAAVSAAVAPVAGAHQACGYLVRGDGVVEAPRFEAVDGAPGLYVLPQPMVPLKDVVLGELPPRGGEPAVRAEWLAFRGAVVGTEGGGGEAMVSLGDDVMGGGVGARRGTGEAASFVAKRPRTDAARLDAVFARVRGVLAAVTDAAPSPPELEDVLYLLSSTVSVHALLPALLSLHHAVVASQAHAGGSTAQLAAATRVLRAVAASPHFGFEAYVQTALPALLTTIAGRALGSGNHRALRALAAETLRDVFEAHGTPVALARATKTLMAALTGEASELRAVYGAVLGLSALGPEVVRIALLPHVPGLVAALRRIAAAIAEAESSSLPGGVGDIDVREIGSRPLPLDAEFIASTCADATALVEAVCMACDLSADVFDGDGGCVSKTLKRASPPDELACIVL